MISRTSLAALKFVVYLLWPATAWATQITIGQTLADVPLLAWLMVFILSTVSGLAALLNSLKLELPKRWPVFIGAHMLGSWLAGVLLFFGLEGAETADLVEAVAIGLGSYAGARLMDKWSDTFVSKITGK